MGIFVRILIPLLLFPLVRWGLPRFLSWVGGRYDRQQAEKRTGGPVIDGHLTDSEFPTRDLRYVDLNRE